MVSKASIKKVEKILERAEEAKNQLPQKVRTSIVLDEDVLKEAKGLQINLSHTLNEFLKYIIGKQKAREEEGDDD